MQKDSKIYFIGGLILAVLIIGLVIYAAKKESAGPGPLDGFATALKTEGATFYGAFWCPHCLATKALFGKSAKLLPYVECSTADGQNQTQACSDQKIESYPTWMFKNGIKVTSSSTPTICPIKTADAKEDGVCANIASAYDRVWVFPEYVFSFKSPIDPIKTGNVWQFPATAGAVGETNLAFLAEQIQFTLPQ